MQVCTFFGANKVGEVSELWEASVTGVAGMQRASTIRRDDVVVVKGKPCRAVQIRTTRTGKHGHAKCMITGVSLFNNRKV